MRPNRGDVATKRRVQKGSNTTGAQLVAVVAMGPPLWVSADAGKASPTQNLVRDGLCFFWETSGQFR